MNLSGTLLIAMPGMGDPRFEKSVVFLCSHSPEGTMGLIVNKPNTGLGFFDLLDQIGIPRTPGARPIRVHYGGPVELGRGFVLHSDDYATGPATMHIPGGFGMTATQDILESLGRGNGPGAAMLALGYAGWGPGQLETEIRRNDWLTCDAKSDLIFSADDVGKWGAALRTIGVDPVSLSSTAGRA